MESSMTLWPRRVRFILMLLALMFSHPFATTAADTPSIQVVDLRCEYKINPLGIDSSAPRLSWRLEGPGRGIAQTAFQIRVAESEAALHSGKPLLWDSGEIRSSDSVQVPYRGPALQSAHRYYWQVRIHDNH